MNDPDADPPPDAVPRMQKLFDNVYLLLAAGVIVMFIVYTGWGIYEILSMPTSTLP
jgi:hypothetical protein